MKRLALSDLDCRSLTESDIDSVAALHRSDSAVAAYYEHEFRRYASTSTIAQLLANPRERLRVATAGGEIHGFCHCWDDGGGLVWVAWVYVSPVARSNGIGTSLLVSLESDPWIEGAHRLWCQSYAERTKSDRLLKSAGYQQLVTISVHAHLRECTLWSKDL